MKKSELQQIIKEEIQNILKEETAQELEQYSDQELISMAEDDGMEEMIVLDGEGGLANRDELIQALSATNEGNVFPMWEEVDNELNESIKHYQKLAGIITEEYGISTKEAKSNDYYKKGMTSQQTENTKLPSEDFSDLVYKDMWEDHLAWAKANRTSNKKNPKYPSEQKQDEYLFSIAPKYGVDPNILKKAIKQYNSLHDRTYGMIPGGLTWQEWTDAKIQSLSNIK